MSNFENLRKPAKLYKRWHQDRYYPVAAAFIYGEPPFYAQVFRGTARLNLRSVDMPFLHPDFRLREEDALSATITLDDAKALFLEYAASDVPLHQSLRAEPWGAQTFIISDPDGNLIAFAS